MIHERTLVVLKPDAIQRNLVGEIIKRFEHRGLKIVGMKMLIASEDMVFAHYNKDDAWFTRKGEGIIKDLTEAGETPNKEALEYGKDIIRGLAKYMTAGPSIAIIYEGHRAQDVVRNMVGETEPVNVDAGTIRGDYGIDSYALCAMQNSRGLRNLIHASENQEDYDAEVGVWFTNEELVEYTHVLERILYDEEISGIVK